MIGPKLLCRALAGTLLLAALPAAAETPETARIHTEAWEAYTEKDGTGLAWDIIHAVYGRAAIDVAATYVPYSRSVQNVLNGDGDAWVGSYADEEPKALYPKWHYDADEVEALFPAAREDSWSGPASLAGARVGWVRGYAYDAYLDQNVAKMVQNDRSRVLKLLDQGIMAYWLDAEYEIDHLLGELPESRRSAYVRKHVLTQELFLGFADDARGRALRRVWDKQFPKLLESGRIAAIYDKWEISFWPFEQPR